MSGARLLLCGVVCLLFANVAPAQTDRDDKIVAGQLIQLQTQGDRQYSGIVADQNETSVVLKDVSIRNPAVTGVPFLSNVPHVNRTFKNVGLTKREQLDCDIIIRRNQIKAWQPMEAVEEKNVVGDELPKSEFEPTPLSRLKQLIRNWMPSNQ